MYYFIQDSANEKGSAKCDITFGLNLVSCWYGFNSKKQRNAKIQLCLCSQLIHSQFYPDKISPIFYTILNWSTIKTQNIYQAGPLSFMTMLKKKLVKAEQGVISYKF